VWSVHPGHPITGKAIYLYLTRYMNAPVTIHGFRSSFRKGLLDFALLAQFRQPRAERGLIRTTSSQPPATGLLSKQTLTSTLLNCV
jgi:hypothetical protein